MKNLIYSIFYFVRIKDALGYATPVGSVTGALTCNCAATEDVRPLSQDFLFEFCLGHLYGALNVECSLPGELDL